ncbi:hypothetical protein [Marinobacterium rhizophilum]|uniref:hypothetical protein n=1 Tax=Marinobacterium rhizophilum TaxID=420402 RepID=UPI0003704430|nr:hypothetical protein [Marinobacterium rhizophilum]
MDIKFKRIFILFSVMALLSACTSNSLYRSEFSACTVGAQQWCELNSIQYYNVGSDDEYTLGFVEIDDQGQLRDRAQMDVLLAELERMAAEQGLLMNVFVHGWHHNARPDDPNIKSFRQSLAQLSELETRMQEQPRKVVGIYVGWRGESIDVPVLNTVTFWERKKTAQEVGQLGMAELLLKLEQIRNVSRAQAMSRQSRLVVVGHSFGGAAVYRATAQILADRFIDSHDGKGFVDTAKGFGDLVVLLNPAIEALNYAPLYDLAQARCSYFADQLPRLVVLTSEADGATGNLFPIGRSLSTFFETHGTIERNECGRPLSYSEGAADRQAVGHFTPLLTHRLRPSRDAQAADYGEIHSIWSQQQAGDTLQFGSTELVSLNKTALRNPYLNVQVSKALIKNHNDVFREEILEFLRMLILLSTRT